MAARGAAGVVLVRAAVVIIVVGAVEVEEALCLGVLGQRLRGSRDKGGESEGEDELVQMSVYSTVQGRDMN